MKYLACIMAMTFAVTACDGEGTSGAASTNAPAVSGAGEALTDEQLDTAEIPVEEDFEEAAASAITEDTVDEQVAALEKEINGDK